MRSAEIGDTFTDQGFQRQGIFTALVTATRDRAFTDGIKLIYGTPNNNSLPGYEKNCNFFRKTKLNMFLCIFPLKPFGVIGEKLKKRGIHIPANFPDRMFNFIMRTALSSDKLCRQVANAEIPEGLNYLNSCLKDKYEFFLPKRAEDINYRILTNPESGRYGMLTSYSTKGLEGLLIFKRNFKRNLSTLFVCEILATSRAVESKLWRSLIRLALDEGHHLVAMWVSRNMERMLPMLPLAAIPVGRRELIFYNHDLGIEALQHPTSQWHFSILDSDNI